MNNRTLGTIAMICAPALLIEGILVRGGESAAITGIASMIFMLGWICANTGLRRMQAAGTGKRGHAVLLVQLAGLILAFAFGFFEATGLLGRDSIIFNVTDAAWPLSMLWMLVVGGTIIVANRLSGWRRIIAVLCPLWLLVAIVGSIAFGEVAGYVALGMTAVLWTMLGYIVRDSSEQAELAAPEPAVR